MTQTTATIRLECPQPYDVPHVLSVLSAHAVPGLETIHEQPAACHRLLPTTNGRQVPATIRFEDDGISLTTTRTATADPALLTTLRQWLDLDTDPRTITAALRADPLIGPLTTARPGLRVIGYVDGFEGAVMTVLGQHVSLAAARTFGSRLVAAYGTPHGDLHAFPTPHTLATANPAELQSTVGITHARARTLHALSAACADGLHISPHADHAAIRAALVGLAGIGNWTVEYLALRALGDRDACPTSDLVLRRALGGATPATVTRMARAWRPWRAYAVSHLWANALGTRPPPVQPRPPTAPTKAGLSIFRCN